MYNVYSNQEAYAHLISQVSVLDITESDLITLLKGLRLVYSGTSETYTISKSEGKRVVQLYDQQMRNYDYADLDFVLKAIAYVVPQNVVVAS